MRITDKNLRHKKRNKRACLFLILAVYSVNCQDDEDCPDLINQCGLEIYGYSLSFQDDEICAPRRPLNQCGLEIYGYSVSFQDDEICAPRRPLNQCTGRKFMDILSQNADCLGLVAKP